MPVSEILPRQRRYVAVPNPLLQEVEALVIFAPRVRFDAAIGRVLVAPVAVDQAADRPAERRGRRSARDPFPQFRSMDPRLRLRLVCVVGQPARLDLVAGGMARHPPRNPIEAVDHPTCGRAEARHSCELVLPFVATCRIRPRWCFDAVVPVKPRLDGGPAAAVCKLGISLRQPGALEARRLLQPIVVGHAELRGDLLVGPVEARPLCEVRPAHGAPRGRARATRTEAGTLKKLRWPL